jgi:hypothetical protein
VLDPAAAAAGAAESAASRNYSVAISSLNSPSLPQPPIPLSRRSPAPTRTRP